VRIEYPVRDLAEVVLMTPAFEEVDEWSQNR
jgi:hypothetical protein